MDKITNCPENVDRQTWQQMCNLRREKIQLEEDLRILGIYLKITYDQCILFNQICHGLKTS